MTPRLAAAAAALLAVTMPASAREPLPPNAEVQAILRQLADRHAIKGVIVGLLDETGARRTIPHGDPGAGARPLDASSVFEIGSITKVFTGILLADMARRGELELADAAADLLPRRVRVPARNGKAITLLDLTTHFSGLPFMPTNLAPANPANPFADYTVERLYEGLPAYELPRDAGERFEYSNLGVGLLGHVLELRAGTSYAELVSARILRPLGMRHTAVTLTPWMKAHLAAGHNRAGTAVSSWDFPDVAGMGGLRSTMDDMLTFAAANLSPDETGLGLAIRDSHRALRQVGNGVDYPGTPRPSTKGASGSTGSSRDQASAASGGALASPAAIPPSWDSTSRHGVPSSCSRTRAFGTSTTWGSTSSIPPSRCRQHQTPPRRRKRSSNPPNPTST